MVGRPAEALGEACSRSRRSVPCFTFSAGCGPFVDWNPRFSLTVYFAGSLLKSKIFTRMLREAPAVRKALFIALVLCAVLSAQAFSFAAEYHHHQSVKNCCWICHLGPLLFVQPVVASSAGPELPVAWMERWGTSGAPRDLQAFAPSSRAPPA